MENLYECGGCGEIQEVEMGHCWRCGNECCESCGTDYHDGEGLLCDDCQIELGIPVRV